MNNSNSYKNVENYLAPEDIDFFKAIFSGTSIALDSEEAKKERDKIKEVYKDPLKDIKEIDHFFTQGTDGSRLFYNSYTMSLGKAAQIDFEFADLKAEHYSEVAKRLYAKQRKINNVRAWQYVKLAEDEYFDEQVRLGNPLPPSYKWLIFGKRLRTTLKWIGRLGLIYFVYDLLVLPGKIEEKRARRRKEKQAAAVGTHAGTTGTVHIQAKSAAQAKTKNLVECIRYGNLLQIRIGSDTVSDGVECAEAEKKDNAEENAGATNADSDTQSNAEPAAAVPPDKPPDPLPSDDNLGMKWLDKIISEVKKDEKK